MTKAFFFFEKENDKNLVSLKYQGQFVGNNYKDSTRFFSTNDSIPTN